MITLHVYTGTEKGQNWSVSPKGLFDFGHKSYFTEVLLTQKVLDGDRTGLWAQKD